MKKKKNWKQLLKELIEETIIGRGIKDEKVITAILSVPRHLFVPSEDKEVAYIDHPLPIGHGQTISQPYMVAYMLKELGPDKNSKVLEIGTGSGYNAALLGRLAKDVYSVEYIKELAERAEKILRELNIDNVKVFNGDGSKGLPEYAPYDRIIVTCSAPQIPDVLLKQLNSPGVLIIPVSQGYYDMLKKVVKHKDGGIEIYDLMPCAFVPMRGRFGF